MPRAERRRTARAASKPDTPSGTAVLFRGLVMNRRTRRALVFRHPNQGQQL